MREILYICNVSLKGKLAYPYFEIEGSSTENINVKEQAEICKGKTRRWLCLKIVWKRWLFGNGEHYIKTDHGVWDTAAAEETVRSLPYFSYRKKISDWCFCLFVCFIFYHWTNITNCLYARQSGIGCLGR